MTKLMEASAMRLSPIHKPSGTPAIAAAAKPAKHRPSVARMFCVSVVSR
jgi:hypothetical protein